MKSLPRPDLTEIFSAVTKADICSLRDFFFKNPTQPLVATGSGGAECSADFAALLYGTSSGVALSVTPYTLNSLSDAALKTSKLLLVSTSGHNNDIVFAAKRGLAVNPSGTAMLCLHLGERNKVSELFEKDGSAHTFYFPIPSAPDGFVASITPFKFFALLVRTFDPDCDLSKYFHLPENPFRIEHNDGTTLTLSDFREVKSFIVLHGSWGRPVAYSLESKLIESGYAAASVSDFRNLCHGRFIYPSNHLDDSAIVMLISPREREIAGRIRGFLPANTKLVIIETSEDAPEASLDLLIRSNEFFLQLCEAAGVNPDSPKNPGKIDKRAPMSIPFVAELKKNGPLK